MTIEKLKLTDIRTDGGTQSRVNLNMFTIEDYAAAMRNGAQFPPIIVYESDEGIYLGDGFHRHAAAVTAGLEEIECDVREGDRRAAILYSVSANATHGQRRTREDVNRAIGMMLRDAVWGRWANNAIAKQISCDPKTVAARRSELEASGEIEPLDVRVAADGRVMNTSKIGDGSQELPTSSMLDDNPSMHPSMPTDDELAVVEPEPAAMPVPKAIPSLVQLSPAPAPRVDNHPIPATPSAAPALLAAAVKPAPAPAPQLVPALKPSAPLPTLTPMPKVIDTSDPKAALKRQQSIASLAQALNAEAQRELHELRTKLDADGVYIEATANPASFANAARMLLNNESIVMQARFLESQVEVVDGE